MTELRLRDHDLHWRDIDGEVVALDGRDSLYLASNASGALLWRCLAGGATREGLRDRLTDAYGLDRDTATRDVSVFLDELDAMGLLEPVRAEASPA
jgi:hypothetical protein